MRLGRGGWEGDSGVATQRVVMRSKGQQNKQELTRLRNENVESMRAELRAVKFMRLETSVGEVVMRFALATDSTME